MLSASQKQIKLHLLITVGVQGLSLDPHDIIKTTSIVLHVSRLLANSTCIQSLFTSEQPLSPERAVTVGAKTSGLCCFSSDSLNFQSLSSHRAIVPLTFLTKVCSE